MFKSVAAIRKANHAIGHHWFSPGSMEFFDTSIETGVYRGRYFVTGERADIRDAVRYTVRRADDAGKVSTVGEFMGYASVDDAINAIKGN